MDLQLGINNHEMCVVSPQCSLTENIVIIMSVLFIPAIFTWWEILNSISVFTYYTTFSININFVIMTRELCTFIINVL